jgi:hypothetical protein
MQSTQYAAFGRVNMVVLDEIHVHILCEQKILAVRFGKKAAMVAMVGRCNHENILNFKTLDLHHAPAQ